MFNGIDLSSDTATQPSQAMLNAMISAPLGDAQKQEDPTTLELESLTAKMFGFDHAMFCPSATMANQIAIQSLCEPGDVFIAASNSHIIQSESGGPAILSSVMCNPILTTSGIFSVDDIQKYNYYHSLKSPKLKTISIENTSNLGGGRVWHKSDLNNLLNYTNTNGLKTHVDGSRIFNASIKTGIPVNELCAGFDMVTICLSKGLGCPVGALLLFNGTHSNKPRKIKQLLGGGMRQSGILAAAGVYALKNNINRLADDHRNALSLAQAMAKIPGIELITHTPETNVILFKWTSPHTSSTTFHDRCKKRNLRFTELEPNIFKAVTHLNITNSNISTTIDIVKDIALENTSMPS